MLRVRWRCPIGKKLPLQHPYALRYRIRVQIAKRISLQRPSAPCLSHGHRPFSSLSSILPTVLLPPIIFIGLFITLWTYKCMMMIIFQNKIIYMPFIPPFSRSEKVGDYVAQTRPVVWKEHDLRARDGVALKLLEGSVVVGGDVAEEKESQKGRWKEEEEEEEAVEEIEGRKKRKKHVAVLYFQGNASSLPPRLPYLSRVLKLIQASSSSSSPSKDTDLSIEIKYTIFALSYRGFWTSSGRASQAGIELDAQAALDHLSQSVLRPQAETTRLLLWGQSIGAGVALTTAATAITRSAASTTSATHYPTQTTQGPTIVMPALPIHSLILETPFLSLRAMLGALYPQRFLPYRHLWPFLRSTWDSEAAVEKIAEYRQDQDDDHQPPLKKILILQAGDDEVVPATQSEALEGICRRGLQMRGLATVEGGKADVEVERVVVQGALHTGVMGRWKGRETVVRHLRWVASEDDGDIHNIEDVNMVNNHSRL